MMYPASYRAVAVGSATSTVNDVDAVPSCMLALAWKGGKKSGVNKMVVRKRKLERGFGKGNWAASSQIDRIGKDWFASCGVGGGLHATCSTLKCPEVWTARSAQKRIGGLWTRRCQKVGKGASLECK